MSEVEKNLREEVSKFLVGELRDSILEMTERLHEISRKSFLKGLEVGSKYVNKTLEVYEVSNKVFRVLFLDKQEAEKFVSQHSPTTGLQINPVILFGTSSEAGEVSDGPG